MSFTTGEFQAVGNYSLDFYLKNDPIDQIGIERPFCNNLIAKKKTWPGGKEYIVETLRVRYQSLFQWFSGAKAVSYNKRMTLEPARFPFGMAHDGFYFTKQDLIHNAISIDDSKKPGNASGAEKVQIRNMYTEALEVLDLGWKEKFDQQMHLDGAQHPDAIAGLESLISTTPNIGTVGGIPASEPYWQNHAELNVANGDLIETMEVMFRDCTRHGGTPTKIYAGSNVVDRFRLEAKSQIARYTQLPSSGGAAELDPSITGLHFHNIPITWNPVYSELETITGNNWENRLYFVNERHLTLKPIANEDMQKHNPPREHNRYVYYWAVTWVGSITTNRRHAHGVITIA